MKNAYYIDTIDTGRLQNIVEIYRKSIELKPDIGTQGEIDFLYQQLKGIIYDLDMLTGRIHFGRYLEIEISKELATPVSVYLKAPLDFTIILGGGDLGTGTKVAEYSYGRDLKFIIMENRKVKTTELTEATLKAICKYYGNRVNSVITDALKG